jgi:hypothetical protein
MTPARDIPRPAPRLAAANRADPRCSDAKLAAPFAKRAARSYPLDREGQLHAEVKSEEAKEVQGVRDHGVDVVGRVSCEMMSDS